MILCLLCVQLPLAPTHVTPFHSSRPPVISVKSYLEDRCALQALPTIIAKMRVLGDLQRTFLHARLPGPACRILKYAGCSEETFILALIYMDQVVQFNPEFVISSLNVHRLLITSIMVPAFEDTHARQAHTCCERRCARHTVLHLPS